MRLPGVLQDEYVVVTLQVAHASAVTRLTLTCNFTRHFFFCTDADSFLIIRTDDLVKKQYMHLAKQVVFDRSNFTASLLCPYLSYK
jgi:hypothetical protein